MTEGLVRTDSRASWRRCADATVVGLLATLAMTLQLQAQQVDAGRLALSDGNQRVGVESFRVWESGATLNAVANVEPSGNRGGEYQVGVQIDPQHRGEAYQVRGPAGRSIDAVWVVDRIRVHSVTAEGERWREYPSRGASTVLEDGVAHHYLVLVRLLESGGEPIQIVVPTRGEVETARLIGSEPSQVTIGERSIAATRYDVRVGNETRRVWVDDDGRLLRVLDPASGREALRLPPR